MFEIDLLRHTVVVKIRQVAQRLRKRLVPRERSSSSAFDFQLQLLFEERTQHDRRAPASSIRRTLSIDSDSGVDDTPIGPFSLQAQVLC